MRGELPQKICESSPPRLLSTAGEGHRLERLFDDEAPTRTVAVSICAASGTTWPTTLARPTAQRVAHSAGPGTSLAVIRDGQPARSARGRTTSRCVPAYGFDEVPAKKRSFRSDDALGPGSDGAPRERAQGAICHTFPDQRETFDRETAPSPPR
jgi:hypothetical protein